MQTLYGLISRYFFFYIYEHIHYFIESLNGGIDFMKHIILPSVFQRISIVYAQIIISKQKKKSIFKKISRVLTTIEM